MVNPSIVIDASIALEWLLHDSAPAPMKLANHALEKIRTGLVPLVPPIWHYEVANVSLLAMQRKGKSHENILEYYALLDELGIATDEAILTLMIEPIRKLASAHRLTVYDAAYLELAQRHGLLLATLDAELAAAALSLNLPLLQPD